jgi:hypothetical protein
VRNENGSPRSSSRYVTSLPSVNFRQAELPHTKVREGPFAEAADAASKVAAPTTKMKMTSRFKGVLPDLRVWAPKGSGAREAKLEP